MSELRKIRLELGLSQIQMARLLHVDQSLLSRVEYGVRSLPALLWSKVQILRRRLQTDISPLQDEFANDRAAIRANTILQLQAQRMDMIKSQAQLASKLNEMQQNFISAQNCLLAVSPERESSLPIPEYHSAVEEIYQEALSTYIKNCPEQQIALEVQLEIIYHSIAVIGARLSALSA